MDHPLPPRIPDGPLPHLPHPHNQESNQERAMKAQSSSNSISFLIDSRGASPVVCPSLPGKLQRTPPTLTPAAPSTDYPDDDFEFEHSINQSFIADNVSLRPSEDVEKITGLLRKRKASPTEAPDHDYLSFKKMSKKSRTLFSKSRRRKHRKRVLEKDEFANDDDYDPDVVPFGNEVLEDPSKIYCYCQQPYNEDLFYIQCDACNQWFCSNCTFLKESQLDSIILFYCIPCEKTTGKKTFRRRLCAAYEYTKKLEIEMEDAMDDDSPGPNFHPDPSHAPDPLQNQHDIVELDPSALILKQIPGKLVVYTHPSTCKTHVPHENDTQNKPLPPSPPLPKNQRKILEYRPNYYCSETCGLSLAAHRLITATPNIPSKALARRNDIKKRKKMAQNISILPVSCRMSPPEIPTSARLETQDRLELSRLQTLDTLLKSRVRALSVWLKRIDGALEMCEQYEKGRKGGPVCGFDSRMVGEWVVPCWKDWLSTCEDKRRDFENDDGNGNDSRDLTECGGEEGELKEDSVEKRLDTSMICMVQGKCSQHVGWRILRVAEVETEMNLGMQDLETNNQAMQRVIDGMRKRREDVKLAVPQ
ncbi:hypothetical protein BDR26DRAFT_859036 [Obelidium mucronatum]|nr:hypothetical protein BDR26DRAFT_859036 [Obelidium mucronatum]